MLLHEVVDVSAKKKDSLADLKRAQLTPRHRKVEQSR
jgi:hypothetical protein